MSPIDKMLAAIGERCKQIDYLAKRIEVVKAGAAEAATVVKLSMRLQDLEEQVQEQCVDQYNANEVVKAFDKLKARVDELVDMQHLADEKVTVDAGIKALERPCWRGAPNALGVWVALFNDRSNMWVTRLSHPESLKRAAESGDEWYGPIPDYEG